MKPIPIVLALAPLCSCAAPPRVGHGLIYPGTPLGNEIATYSLQENVVTFKATTTGEGDKKKTTVTAETDREDHEGVRVALLAVNRPGINTDVTIKKFENTDIPSEVTVKVEDTRADLIKKTGEVVVAAVKSGLLPFSGGPDAVLPARVNLTAQIDSDNQTELSKHTDSNIDISFGPIPPDAVRLADVVSRRGDSYFYYAACRKALVSFHYGGQDYQFTYKVSDPHYLQRQRMPIDGKIVMHSQCGASVTGKLSGYDAASALAITSALIAQGQSISDALKAQNKKDETAAAGNKP